jgi:hypothetical protein
MSNASTVQEIYGLHLWTFDDQGKVVRMRHYIDTAQHLAAHA